MPIPRLKPTISEGQLDQLQSQLSLLEPEHRKSMVTAIELFKKGIQNPPQPNQHMPYRTPVPRKVTYTSPKSLVKQEQYPQKPSRQNLHGIEQKQRTIQMAAERFKSRVQNPQEPLQTMIGLPPFPPIPREQFVYTPPKRSAEQVNASPAPAQSLQEIFGGLTKAVEDANASDRGTKRARTLSSHAAIALPSLRNEGGKKIKLIHPDDTFFHEVSWLQKS